MYLTYPHLLSKSHKSLKQITYFNPYTEEQVFRDTFKAVWGGSSVVAVVKTGSAAAAATAI